MMVDERFEQNSMKIREYEMTIAHSFACLGSVLNENNALDKAIFSSSFKAKK